MCEYLNAPPEFIEFIEFTASDRPADTREDTPLNGISWSKNSKPTNKKKLIHNVINSHFSVCYIFVIFCFSGRCFCWMFVETTTTTTD